METKRGMTASIPESHESSEQYEAYGDSPVYEFKKPSIHGDQRSERFDGDGSHEYHDLARLVLFDNGEDLEEEEEEDALTLAAKLGRMLLQNKAELEAEVESLRETLDEYSTEANELRRAVNEWQVKYTKSMEAMEQAHQLIGERESDVATMRSKIDREVTAANELATENGRLLEQIEHLTVYVRNLEELNSKKSDHIEVLKTNLADSEEALFACQSESFVEEQAIFVTPGKMNRASGAHDCCPCAVVAQQRLEEENLATKNRQRELENDLQIACHELTQAHKLIEELALQVADQQQQLKDAAARLDEAKRVQEHDPLSSLSAELEKLRLVATPIERERKAISEHTSPLLGRAKSMHHPSTGAVPETESPSRRTSRFEDDAMYQFFDQLPSLGQNAQSQHNTPSRRASFQIKGPNLLLTSEHVPGGPSQIRRGLSFAVLSPPRRGQTIARGDTIRKSALTKNLQRTSSLESGEDMRQVGASTPTPRRLDFSETDVRMPISQSTSVVSEAPLAPVAMGTDASRGNDDAIINALDLAEKERATAAHLRNELQSIRGRMEKLTEETDDKIRMEQQRTAELVAHNDALTAKANELEQQLSSKETTAHPIVLLSNIGKVLDSVRSAVSYSHTQYEDDKPGKDTAAATYLVDMCERTGEVVDDLMDCFQTFITDQSFAVSSDLKASIATFGTALSHTLMAAGAISRHDVTGSADTKTRVAQAGLQLLQLLRCDGSVHDSSHAASAAKAVQNALQTLSDQVTEQLGEHHRRQQELKAVDREMSSTAKVVSNAAKRIEDMLEKSKAAHCGINRDIDDSILGECAILVERVNELVRVATLVQQQMVSDAPSAADLSTPQKQFYKKDHRWNDGLVSAAQAVGWCANVLVDSAEEALCALHGGEGHEGGKVEKLIVASREVAASTVQLVTASWAKQKGEANAEQKQLESASKLVNDGAKAVVKAAQRANELRDREDNVQQRGMFGTPRENYNLSAMQNKRREMELQVRILSMESQLDKERKLLAELRKAQYK